MKLGYLIAGGGLAAAIAGFVGLRKAAATKKTVTDAVSGASSSTKAKIQGAATPAALRDAVEEAAPPAPDDVRKAAAAGDADAVKDSSWYTGTFQARVTGYWPVSSSASESEKKMEGGNEGAAVWRGRRAVDQLTGKRAKLHTLEDAKSGKAPYVSVSADPDVFPWGQMIHLDEWPGIDFRVVDTGGHFKGAGKVYRAFGREPLDIRVPSSKTKVVADTTGHIDVGNHWDKEGEAVAVEKMKGQTVAVGGRVLVGALHMLGARAYSSELDLDAADEVDE